MTAQEKFESSFDSGKHLCIGLDTDVTKIPQYLLKCSDPVLEFNTAIIEATSEYAAAYKINLAFYERYGAPGMESLSETIEIVPSHIPVIADGKRNDIGNTAEQYAIAIYDHLGFDCATVNPYMGFDSIDPFLRYSDKIAFILTLTSNPGAADFEKLFLQSGKQLYQEVLSKVVEWNKNSNCGSVFGATQLEELRGSIDLLKGLYTLIPGIGAQGGDLGSVVGLFSQNANRNFIINMSRNILYADGGDDFAQVSNSVAAQAHEAITNAFASA